MLNCHHLVFHIPPVHVQPINIRSPGETTPTRRASIVRQQDATQRPPTPCGIGMEAWVSEHDNHSHSTPAQSPKTTSNWSWPSLKHRGVLDLKWVEIPLHSSCESSGREFTCGEHEVENLRWGEGELKKRQGTWTEGVAGGEGEEEKERLLSPNSCHGYHRNNYVELGRPDNSTSPSPTQDKLRGPPSIHRESSQFFSRRVNYCDQEEDEDKTDFRGVCKTTGSQITAFI